MITASIRNGARRRYEDIFGRCTTVISCSIGVVALGAAIAGIRGAIAALVVSLLGFLFWLRCK